jgi:hypothetical protein
MDHSETLATLGTLETEQRLEKTKGAIKNGPFRDSGNIGHRRMTKEKQQNTEN